MPLTKNIVELKGVTVSHSGGYALEDIDFGVGPGQFAAVIGPNGAGKTTLARVILGLVEPEAGSVRVFGMSPDKMGAVRSHVGYVPQILSVDISFPVTVREVVMMGLYGKLGAGRRPGKEESSAVAAVMEDLDITRLADRPIERLSGGQRQRAFVARALVGDPKLLILDEPTTGVDSSMTGGLFEILGGLKKEGVSIILITHDVSVVASYIDVLGCLNRKMVAHGRPEEVLTDETLKKMYGCDTMFLHHGNAPHIVVEGHEC